MSGSYEIQEQNVIKRSLLEDKEGLLNENVITTFMLSGQGTGRQFLATEWEIRSPAQGILPEHKKT